MKVGIPKEIYPNERRVAASPTTVQKLKKLGLDVVIQSGAGEAATYSDAVYIEAGATIAEDAPSLWDQSDIVLKVRPPMENEAVGKHEADLLKEGARLIGFIWPAQNKSLMERLVARKATVLAMDAMPRITRAQKMDALSATANIVGYRAVLEGASHFQRFIPGQVTAAGRVKPATVLIVGAGVAGLAAIAAARSLGAIVKAFDTRPAVREQVESLGAQFLEFKFEESGEGEGGYAKAMSEAYIAAEQAMIAQHAKESDLIVTTALIPGMPAPKLVTSGAVVSMRPGSVIVDLAAEQGGNCALTEPDKVVERFGVTIVGLTDIASRMANQSSDLYAVTVYNLLEELITKDGQFVINMEDEAQRGCTVIKDGEVTWPPPKRPPQRAGAPRPEPEKKAAPAKPAEKPANTGVMMLLAAIVLGGLGVVAPPEFMSHFTVFLLACVVGWHVIWGVTAALHTPLMSVTNAISGIILIGGMLLVSGLGAGSVLAAVAVLLASINVAGGFLVTQRMLKMFRK